MRKLSGDDAVRLLREVAEAMAVRAAAGAPVSDARLLRELATRLLDAGDAWQKLALDALVRVLDEGTVASRSGALALAEMLRELEDGSDKEKEGPVPAGREQLGRGGRG
jgi:hypothetical protein